MPIDLKLAVILLSALLIICAAVIAVLAIRSAKLKREAGALAEDVGKFLLGGEKTNISLSDDDFSALLNAVADLEERVCFQEAEMQAEIQKNSEFIADISHQLKTPLAAMRLYCELQENSLSEAYGEKQLLLIEKMEMLIKKLLRLEKLRSDAYQMNFEMHDIGEIARAQAVQFASIYPSKTITVTGSDCFRLDSEWIAEAIGNVLKNACEHTAENGKIDIRVYGSEFENVTTVEIEDNGGGVPESELPKLFVRFYKSPNSSAESTGIGLALTRVIVEKHHGKISARNKTQGLCITMCFPHEIYNSAI